MLDFSGFPYSVIEPGFSMDVERMANLKNEDIVYCVWHHTGGRDHDSTAAQTNRYHSVDKGWAGIGYHGQIRWNGQLELGRPLNKRGVHASAVNTISIGFCLSGNFEIGDIMTRPDQFYSAAQLAALVTRSIPGIKHVRHMEVGATACNGKLFPWESFLEEVDAVLNPEKHIDDVIYRVQVGAFKVFTYAQKMLQDAKRKGFDTYLVQGDDGLYRVQVGAYRNQENAYAKGDAVKKAGFDFYITTQAGRPAASPPDEVPPPQIKVGSKVRVKQGARDYNGVRLASFVYSTTYDVIQISGNRAVIGLGKAVTAAVRINDLILQK